MLRCPCPGLVFVLFPAADSVDSQPSLNHFSTQHKPEEHLLRHWYIGVRQFLVHPGWNNIQGNTQVEGTVDGVFVCVCVCVCVSPPVSKALDHTKPLYSAGGQRLTTVFLHCPTKLGKTGGIIQGRLNVYLLIFKSIPHVSPIFKHSINLTQHLLPVHQVKC